MTDQTNRGKIQRDARGKNQHTIQDSINDADAAQLKAMGLTYRQIASQQDISVGTAYQRVKRALAVAPVLAAEHLRAMDNDMLDMVQAEMMSVMRAKHSLVSHGRLIAGQFDVRPKIMAANTLIRLSGRRAALNGYEAPVKHEIKVSDKITAEIEELARQLGIAPALEELEVLTAED